MAYNNTADDYGYQCDNDFDYRQYDSDNCPDDREEYDCYDPQNSDDYGYDYDGLRRRRQICYGSGKCNQYYDSDIETTPKYCVMTNEIHTVT